MKSSIRYQNKAVLRKAALSFATQAKFKKPLVHKSLFTSAYFISPSLAGRASKISTSRPIFFSQTLHSHFSQCSPHVWIARVIFNPEFLGPPVIFWKMVTVSIWRVESWPSAIGQKKRLFLNSSLTCPPLDKAINIRVIVI